MDKRVGKRLENDVGTYIIPYLLDQTPQPLFISSPEFVAFIREQHLLISVPIFMQTLQFYTDD